MGHEAQFDKGFHSIVDKRIVGHIDMLEVVDRLALILGVDIQLVVKESVKPQVLEPAVLMDILELIDRRLTQQFGRSPRAYAQ